MALRLATAVHAVMVDDDLVLLDLTADTYFCLPLRPGDIVVDGHRLETPHDALGQALAQSGLAATETAMTEKATGSAAERAGEAGRGAPPPRPGHTARRLIETAGASLDARLNLRRLMALARAVEIARRGRKLRMAGLIVGRPRGEPTPIPDALLADLAAYRRVSPWLPFDGNCLFRSHMLDAYLRALGHRVDWVFGVRTWPFRAHCWLQAGDTVLDDEHERLLVYRPIAAA